MRTVSEIRRLNLLRLARECGSQRALADRLGRSPAQVNQWAQAAPSSRSGKPRVISNDTAREIERTFGKPEGWLDLDADAPRSIQTDAEILEMAFKAVRRFEASNDVTLGTREKAVLVSALYVHIAAGAKEASEEIGRAIVEIRRKFEST